MKRIISPSFLSADFADLRSATEMINGSAAEWIHLDVMDGRFVPNITFGFDVIKAVRRHTDKVLDVHLMIAEPERYVERFAEAGADYITVHAEAAVHLHRVIQTIKSSGKMAGVALNPATPLSVVEEVLDMLDMVLVMSVNPGFAAQKFIPSSVDKVRRLRAMADARGCEPLIEVDGGVSPANAGVLFGSGADVLVAGNAVFGADNPREAIVRLLESR
ncbi:MAG: ribulose-phosphate 3-epimerase [Rikenellaceae bacterium]|nr:ribulose-phosphate 3-epimerase [Rikenellaceae bacterium]